MKKRTFDRQTAAVILILYRKAVRTNWEKPTKENWEDVCNWYKRVSTLGLLGIISRAAQSRGSKMFDECTAVL